MDSFTKKLLIGVLISSFVILAINDDLIQPLLGVEKK